MSDYELFQIEITKNYTTLDWREDVKKMLRKAGYDGVSTVFLFGDHQVKVCPVRIITRVVQLIRKCFGKCQHLRSRDYKVCSGPCLVL